MAKKLMIVDDFAVSRHVLRRAAAAPQDTVLECVSPDEALREIKTFQPDCVVVGVSQALPEWFQAIKSIRESHPDVRVVAVSHFHENRLQQMAEEAGASGYIATENLSELFVLAAPGRLPSKSARHKGRRRRQT